MNLALLAGNAPTNLNLTVQQQAILNSSSPTLLINAVAGSGKTATLMEMAKNYDNGLYLAFNKAIVKDVMGKLPMGWQCNTFNSFGLRIVKENLPDVKVNFNKYKESGESIAAQLAADHMSLSGNISWDSWFSTCQRFNTPNGYIPDAKELLKQGKANTSVISGEDMLQFPIDNGWKSRPYDIVLVDECQDLNPQQIDFLSCIPTKKIVFVGDSNQAIYGFRGSDPFALERVKDIYNPIEFDLSQSFRCPKEVLHSVKHIVPHISSMKTGGSINTTTIKEAVFTDDCFIISRTNSQLISLAYKFIQLEEDFSIGTNFVNQLQRNLSYITKGARSIKKINATINTRYKNDLMQAATNKWSTANIVNRYEGLRTIVNSCKTLGEIREFISNLSMHKDGASNRKLMTIHASKGLETPHVFFLKSGLCEYFKSQTEVRWERQQEDNLYYVACTRALEKLTFVD